MGKGGKMGKKKMGSKCDEMHRNCTGMTLICTSLTLFCPHFAPENFVIFFGPLRGEEFCVKATTEAAKHKFF